MSIIAVDNDAQNGDKYWVETKCTTTEAEIEINNGTFLIETIKNNY